MHNKQQSQNLISRSISIAAKAALTIAIVLAQPSQAQTYRVIHDFTGGVDGAGTAPAGSSARCTAFSAATTVISRSEE